MENWREACAILPAVAEYQIDRAWCGLEATISQWWAGSRSSTVSVWRPASADTDLPSHPQSAGRLRTSSKERPSRNSRACGLIALLTKGFFGPANLAV